MCDLEADLEAIGDPDLHPDPYLDLDLDLDLDPDLDLDLDLKYTIKMRGVKSFDLILNFVFLCAVWFQIEWSNVGGAIATRAV